MADINDNEKLANIELIARKIEQLMRITGDTQEDIALKAGYSNNSMINQIIKRRLKGPSLHSAKKLAEAYGLPGGYLLDNTEYDDEDIKLIIAVHDMIRRKNSDSEFFYGAVKKLMGIE